MTNKLEIRINKEIKIRLQEIDKIYLIEKLLFACNYPEEFGVSYYSTLGKFQGISEKLQKDERFYLRFKNYKDRELIDKNLKTYEIRCILTFLAYCKYHFKL